MGRKRRFWGHTGRWCARGACLTTNMLLVGLFVGQLLLGLGLTARFSTPFQGWLLQQLNSRLQVEGLRLESAFVGIDPTGGLTLNGAILKAVGGSEPVLLEADAVLLEVDLTGTLFGGQLELEQLAWRGLRLRHPLEGVESPPLLHSAWGQSQLDGLAYLARVHVAAAARHGRAHVVWSPEVAWQTQARFEGPVQTWDIRLSHALRQLANALEQTQAVPEASVRAQLTATPGQRPKGEIRLWAPKVEPVEAGMRVGFTTVAVTAAVERQRGVWRLQDASAEVVQATWADGYAQGIRLQLAQPGQPLLPITGHAATVRLQALEAWAWEAEKVTLHWPGQTSLEVWPTVTGAAVFLGEHLTFTAQPREAGWQVALSGRVDFADLLRHPVVGQSKRATEVQLTRPARFQAQVTWQPEAWRADFTVSLVDFVFQNVAFADLWAGGQVDATGLDLHDLAVFDGPGEYVVGSYGQDWATRDFRITARGHIFPDRITLLLKRDWYTKLWQDLRPQGGPLWGDFQLRSRWGARGFTHTFTGARGASVTYHGYPVETARVRVRQGNDQLHLYLDEVGADGGVLHGALMWHGSMRHHGQQTMWFDLASNLPLDAVRGALGPNNAMIPRTLALDGLPVITAQGTFFNRREAPSQRALTFTVETVLPGRFDKLAFTAGRAQGVLQNQRLMLHPLEVHLQDGLVTGSLSLDDLGAASPDWQLSLELADVPDVALLPLLGSGSDAPSRDSETPVGRLDGRFVLAGQGKATERLRGEGEVLLTERRLRTIRIFGGLSRLLEGAGLPSGSLALDQVSGRFNLADNQLQWPEVLITGPSMRVSAVGQLDLATQGLNFQATSQLLKTPEGGKLRDVFSVLLRPVTGAFRVQLGGTLPEPDWRLTFNPLRSLQMDPTPLLTTPENPPAAASSAPLR